jgi:PAS domain S-box-containing protein
VGEERSARVPASDLVLSAAILYALGGCLCLATVVFHVDRTANPQGLALVVAAAGVCGGSLRWRRRHSTRTTTHLSTGIGSLLVALSVYWGGQIAGAFAFGYVLSAMFCFAAFRHRTALLHVALMSAMLAVVLIGPIPGGPPLRHEAGIVWWLVVTAGALTGGVLTDRLAWRMHQLAENSADIVMRLRPDGTCSYISPSGARVNRLEEVLDHHAARLLHPSERPEFESILTDIREGGRPATFVHRFGGQTDFDRWYETMVLGVADSRGRLVQIKMTSHDITERRKAEEALRHSRQQLQLVVGNAPVVLFAIDRHGIITLAEGKGMEAIGLGPGEAVGKALAEIYWNEPQVLHHMEAALAGEASSVEIEPAALRLALEVRFNPIRNNSGVVTGVIAVATDISERRRADAARRESDAKTRFLAQMSHELRTPLNSVLGFAELLATGSDPLSERQGRYVQHIGSSGQHLLKIINELLDLARSGAEQVEIDLEDVDLDRLITEAAAAVVPQVEAKQIQLRTSSDDGIQVRSDSQRLLQVLLNLLSNAIKFTPPNGTISIGSRRGRNEAVIWVSDTGVGISGEDLDRIFDEFVQLKNGDQEHSPGTGLGLPVSRRLLELLGGNISVESKVGAGSVFTVTIPIAEVGQAQSNGGDDTARKARGRRGAAKTHSSVVQL